MPLLTIRKAGRTRSCAVLVLLLATLVVCALAGCAGSPETDAPAAGSQQDVAVVEQGPADFSIEDVPPYEGSPSVEIDGNRPWFSAEDLSRDSFETYSALDSLGRCGTAYALIGTETMPTAERGSIGMVKPSGWCISEYDWIDGGYLFNRCHLIAFCLAGENDNSLNLITGTRSMNVLGMLPYEERVAAYVDKTSNHVLYRVTPVFEGDNLVASGVLMEAESVEDGGEGISFCVWCYNVEPGVVIDYATGDNEAGDPAGGAYDTVGEDDPGDQGTDESAASPSDGEASATDDGESAETVTGTYVLNVNTHRFHYPDCPSVFDMKSKNRREFTGAREEVVENGYQPCGVCKP